MSGNILTLDLLLISLVTKLKFCGAVPKYLQSVTFSRYSSAVFNYRVP